jgi:hypothetical protein
VVTDIAFAELSFLGAMPTNTSIERSNDPAAIVAMIGALLRHDPLRF